MAMTTSLPTKVIKKGSKGTEVKKWQNYLKSIGYNLTVDGIFGSVTADKTKDFQKKCGLTADGIVGDKTIAKAKVIKTTKDLLVANKVTTTHKYIGKAIDVSAWQSNVDWKKVKADGYRYAIIRSSYTGQSSFSMNKDSCFDKHIKGAIAAGLKVGAYHYSQAITVTEAKKEAEFMCKVLAPYKNSINFWVACDYEFGKRLNSKIGTKASNIVNAFCDVLKAKGYPACIYGNLSMMNNYLKVPEYPVWLAQYSSSCSYGKSKIMWQNTSSKVVDGISGKVDSNYVYKEPTIAKPPVPTTSHTPTHYSGELPLIHIKKTSAQAIADSLKWGKMIADNNNFHYGEGGRSSMLGTNIYSVTHKCGCYFCNGNKRKIEKAKKYKIANPNNWLKTYVCCTFVTAMWAHGAQEPRLEKTCHNGGSIGCNTKPSPLKDMKDMKSMGKLPISKLKKGDILVSPTHVQAVYAPISSTKCKIIEATSYTGKYHSTSSNVSIGIHTKKPSYTNVYRYVGNIDRNLAIQFGEYSDRVKKLQKFLNWYGEYNLVVDGICFESTVKAIKDFQKKEDLTVDGKFDNNCLRKAKAIKK